MRHAAAINQVVYLIPARQQSVIQRHRNSTMRAILVYIEFALGGRPDLHKERA